MSENTSRYKTPKSRVKVDTLEDIIFDIVKIFNTKTYSKACFNLDKCYKTYDEYEKCVIT